MSSTDDSSSALTSYPASSSSNSSTSISLLSSVELSVASVSPSSPCHIHHIVSSFACSNPDDGYSSPQILSSQSRIQISTPVTSTDQGLLTLTRVTPPANQEATQSSSGSCVKQSTPLSSLRNHPPANQEATQASSGSCGNQSTPLSSLWNPQPANQ